MLYVINYADGQPYKKYQEYNTWSARYIGKADRIIQYSSDDIDKHYMEEHKDIFAYKRGGGLWLWKPYLINKTLKQLNEGDWLFYTDSGSLFINDIHKLINNAIKNNTDIMLFGQPTLNRQFCKRETFLSMGVDDNNENQTLGIMLLQKTHKTVCLIHEWLKLCEQEQLISPKKFNNNIKEFEDFYAHREDQAILSLLRIKYNIPMFRDCSDYGIFTYDYYNPNWTYNPLSYDNSDYPTILLCNRRCHPVKYLIFYIAKRFLKMINIYTEKNKIKKINKKSAK